jgi:serine phosphatase RsbU (regulator of sigma subunit)
VTLPLRKGDVFVFCSDGIFEAMDEEGQEFGAQRLCEVVREYRHQSARRLSMRCLTRSPTFQRGAPRQTT